MAIRIAVQTEDFDLSNVHARLRDNPRCGALVTFTGLVRDLPEGGLNGLTPVSYTHLTLPTKRIV